MRGELRTRAGNRPGQRFDLQRGSVSDLIVGDDCTRLVEVSADAGVAAVWRLDGGGPASRLVLPGDGITVDGYTPDGSGLLVSAPTADGTELSVVDTATGRNVEPLPGVAIAATTSDPSGLLVVPTGAQAVALYDLRAHELISGSQVALPFAPDAIAVSGDVGLAWTQQGKLRVIDVRSRRITAR